MKIIKDINSSARVRHFDIVFYGSNLELLKCIHTYRDRIKILMMMMSLKLILKRVRGL